jgi:hypothetical protein
VDFAVVGKLNQTVPQARSGRSSIRNQAFQFLHTAGVIDDPFLRVQPVLHPWFFGPLASLVFFCYSSQEHCNARGFSALSELAKPRFLWWMSRSVSSTFASSSLSSSSFSHPHLVLICLFLAHFGETGNRRLLDESTIHHGSSSEMEKVHRYC